MTVSVPDTIQCDPDGTLGHMIAARAIPGMLRGSRRCLWRRCKGVVAHEPPLSPRISQSRKRVADALDAWQWLGAVRDQWRQAQS